MEMEEMDLLEYWRILVKRKKLIVLLFIVTVLTAGIVSYMMDPVYEATATLMVRDQQAGQMALFDPTGGALGRNAVQNYVQILRSRTILSQTLRNMGMELEPDGSLSWITNNLTIQPVQNTEVLRISMQSTDPHQATEFVNTLSDTFIEWNRTSNQEEMRSARSFIEGQLATVSQDLRRAEDRLRGYRESERVLSPSEETKAALERYATFETRLAETEVERVELKRRIARIEEQLEREEETLISSTTIADNPHLREYRRTLAELEVKLSGARERYTARHPEVLALQAEINSVHEKIANEVERVINTETRTVNPIHSELYGNLINLQVQTLALDAREQALVTLRDQSLAELESLPQKELELARLMRDTTVLEEIYLMLMTRNEEIRISEAMQVADVQVIDNAVVPRSPIKPRIRLNIAIAGVLGLFLGTGLALLLEYIDTSIKTKEEVEALLQLPVLGQIPDFSVDNKQMEKSKLPWRK